MGLHSRQPRKAVEPPDVLESDEEGMDSEESPRRNHAVKRRRSDKDMVSAIEKIDDDALQLDVDYFMRKHYPEIRDAAEELPLVMEAVNEALHKVITHHAVGKIELNNREAQAYTRLRQEWSTRFTDKMTEAALDRAMALDDDLNEERKRIAVLKGSITRYVNLQENLRIKLDAMRSVESTRRKLVQDDPDPEK